MSPQRLSFFRGWLSGSNPTAQLVEKESTGIDTGDTLLERLCAPPENWWKDDSSRINPENFNEIAKFVETIDKERKLRQSHYWSKRPRLYTVLRNIEQIGLLDDFVSRRLTDFNLPFSEQTLPEFVDDEEIREAFLMHQRYVLTEKKCLELGGRHMLLDESADNYFHHVKDLGQGGYGAVDHVVSTLSLRSYARKCVLRGPDSDDNRRAQRYIIEELSALKALSHLHLVQYIGSYTDKSHIAFLMSPVADMDLRRYLNQLKNVGNYVASLRYFFGCLAGAVEYLHKNEIRHRDIKSNNILVKNDRVFISDFGTVYVNVKSGTRRTTTHDRNLPQTFFYMAPEVANHGQPKMPSDMWSLGVVFLEIATILLGSTLYAFHHHLESSARNKQHEPNAWNNIDAVYAWTDKLRKRDAASEQDNETLVWTRALLKAKPEERLDAGQLMQRIHDSPSFSAFCCLDCRPQYDHQSYMAHRQSIQHDVKRQTTLSSQTIYDQVAALFEGNPPTEPDPKELERQTTIENWITSVAEIYNEPEASPGLQDTTSYTEKSTITTENSSLPFDIVEDRTAAAQKLEPEESSNVEGELFDNDEVLVSSPAVHRTAAEPLELKNHGQDIEATMFKTASKVDAYFAAPFTVQTNPWTVEDPTSYMDWPISTIQDQATNNIWSTEDPVSHYPEESGHLIDNFHLANVWDCDTQTVGITSVRMPIMSMTTLVASSAIEAKVLPVEGCDRTIPPADYFPPPPTPSLVSREVKTHDAQEIIAKTDSTQGSLSLVTTKKAPLQEQTVKCVELEILPDLQQVLLESAKDRTVPSPDIWKEEQPQRSVQSSKAPPLLLDLLAADQKGTYRDGLNQRKESAARDPEPFTVPAHPVASSNPREPSENTTKKPPTNLRGRPYKPSITLLHTALENAARQRENEAAGTEFIAQPFSVFSAEVYMEKKWEGASTQVTQDDRGEVARLSLTRWLERDNQLLEKYCHAGRPQAVRHLLKKGCNPGTTKKPRPMPLIYAVRGGTPQHYKCVQALLRKGVNLNVQQPGSGKTALHLAIETPDFKGHTNLVRDLTAGGANPNIPDASGEFPIHAIFKGGQPGRLEKHRLDALACILKADIHGDTDVNTPDAHDVNSPLHLAIGKLSPVAVGMLLHKGADVNAVNSFGLTPLLLAATQWSGPLTEDQEITLDLLLKVPGIKIDETSGLVERTALHWAVLRCSPSAVRLLLERGAAELITDIHGKTPVELLATVDERKWPKERREIRALLCSTGQGTTEATDENK